MWGWIVAGILVAGIGIGAVGLFVYLIDHPMIK